MNAFNDFFSASGYLHMNILMYRSMHIFKDTLFHSETG